MGPKDYISILAVLVASVSLFVSLRTANFTRRVKFAEMRVATLAKVCELFATIARSHHLQSEILTLAEQHDNSEVTILIEGLEIETLTKAIHQLHRTMSEAPVALSVSVYEDFFHELDRLSVVSREIQARLQSALAKLEDQSSAPRP